MRFLVERTVFLYLLCIPRTIRDLPKKGYSYTHFSCTARTAASTREVTLSLEKTDSRCFSTVFWLIPAVSVYTIVLGTISLVSSLADRTGDFGHRCARGWAWLILKTTGVRVDVRWLGELRPVPPEIDVSAPGSGILSATSGTAVP